MTTLRTKDLRLVATVAAEGTVTAAAEILGISQPAASRQLKALEARLGVPLFGRTSTGMLPTAAGLRLLDQAEPLLARLRSLEADMEQLARGETGTIRVTTQCYTSYGWLPEILPALREEFPGVDVQIIPEAASDPIGALFDRAVDLALAYHFHDSTDRLTVVPLFQDELVLLVGPDHPLATREYVTAEDFADEHLLAYTRDPEDSWFWQTILEPADVTPRRVSGLRLTEGILALVAAGVGVTVLTRWTAAREIADGTVRAIPVGRQGLWRSWSAVLLKEAFAWPYLERFVSLMSMGPAQLFDPEPTRLREAAAIRVIP